VPIVSDNGLYRDRVDDRLDIIVTLVSTRR
jgi:hypothetical protein